MLGVERCVLAKERGLPVRGADRDHQVVLVDERVDPHGEAGQLLDARRSERDHEVVPRLDPGRLRRTKIQPQTVAEARVRLYGQMLNQVPLGRGPTVNWKVGDRRLDIDVGAARPDVRRHDEDTLANLGPSAPLGRKQMRREHDRPRRHLVAELAERADNHFPLVLVPRARRCCGRSPAERPSAAAPRGSGGCSRRAFRVPRPCRAGSRLRKRLARKAGSQGRRALAPASASRCRRRCRREPGSPSSAHRPPRPRRPSRRRRRTRHRGPREQRGTRQRLRTGRRT